MQSMAELLKRRSRLTDYEVRFYMLQLIEALNFLHRNLVIHRDLKLGNLFLDKDLNVKVGDFGLAARLTSSYERRRTVCGTPNYIAPEILEGKDGHSFEVDVWSSGVIMYTLLVGTPPFQAADVKATYNRVLSNQYSFPSSTPVCEHAENLIRHLLQHRPENRPKVERVTQHSFFSRSSAHTPSSLPQSCLKEPYVIPSKELFMKDSEISAAIRNINDENDPGLMNRQQQEHRIPINSKPMPPQNVHGSTVAPAPFSGNVLREKQVEAVAPIPRRPVVPARSNSVTAGTTSNGFKTATTATTGCKEIRDPVSGSLAQRWNSVDCENAKVQVEQVVSSGPSLSSKMSTRSQGVSSTATTATVASTNSRRFEVYNDNKGTVNTYDGTAAASQNDRTGNNEHLVPEKRPLGGYPSSFSSGMSIQQRKNLLEKATSGSRSSSSSVEAGAEPANAVDVIQHNLEGVRLTTDRYSTRSKDFKDTAVEQARSAYVLPVYSSSESMKACGSEDLRPANINNFTPSSAPRKPVVAWSANEDNVSITKPAVKSSSSSRQPEVRLQMEQLPPALSPEATNQQVFKRSAALVPNGAMHTPPEQFVKRDDKALNTLETMHEVLSNTYNGCCNDDSMLGELQLKPQKANIIDPSKRQEIISGSRFGPAATVWVVGYVDYTTKYGFGFLLNTGSAGVYFNDNTKIIMSADGKIFQYIERRRAYEGSSSGGHNLQDNVVQTHAVNRYPVELQKKVTLMVHFKNYLADQRATNAARQNNGEDGDENKNNNLCHLEATAKPSAPTTVTGASADVAFGVSSAVYGNELETEMPFLKKWVRTRHALLFRLSNKTVQIVFFDRR
jgi:serine/threonine protein kinase